MSEDHLILDHEEQELNEHTVEINLASTGLRFANFIIDTVVFYIVTFILFFIIAFFAASMGEHFEIKDLGFYIISMVLYAVYYFMAESLFGTTIGKRITRTRIVTAKGTEPSTFDYFIRSISRLIPFEPFSFFGNLPIGWHDSISQTRIIGKKLVNPGLY